MSYSIVLPPEMAHALQTHLLGDRTTEQMAIVLCGQHRTAGHVRLLGRHLILMPPEAFTHQSAGGLALAPDVQRHVLRLAAQEGLSQIDWHTHPGEESAVTFSRVDDHNERALAAYLSTRLPRTVYASVVLNTHAMAARVWQCAEGQPVPVAIPAPDLTSSMPLGHPEAVGDGSAVDVDRFDRQVRAFGHAFQHRLRALRVAVVGVGGLGSIAVEQLARLGVRHWVLVDPDYVETSNLNRLLGATERDVHMARPKVKVATRTIRRIDAHARISSLRTSVFAPRTLTRLKACDLLIAATDNDASRLVLNALACQYLIPLVHVGVNLEPGEGERMQDVSGEVAIPPLGSWCLLCAGILSAERATWDLARPEERTILVSRGYLAETPAPAVYHLNGVAASLAVTEIHNLIYAYKPLRRYLVYRELEGELMPLEVPRSEHCLHCSPTGLLGLGDLAPVWYPRQRRELLTTSIPAASDVSCAAPQEGMLVTTEAVGE